MDGVHQLGGELEVVEAGLAFGRLDLEVFQLPGVDRLGRRSRRGGLAGLAAGSVAAAADGVASSVRLGLAGRLAVSCEASLPRGVAGVAGVLGCSPSALPNIFLSALSTVISSIG
ncbi:hypothetical protein I0D68_14595 [Pseudomonas lalucatii]|nr:hypothetical protein [Pseudomonas lalucatii]QVM86867.1 hypothetical protein I0D68_14595 [Pseudomonas lalucatii]